MSHMFASFWTKQGRSFKALSARPAPGTVAVDTSSTNNLAPRSVNVDYALPFEAIPGPACLPLLGCNWMFFPFIGNFNIDKMHHSRKYLREKYGNLVRFDIGMRKMVIAFDPNDIETVFRNQGKLPNRPVAEGLKAVREELTEYFSTPGVTFLNGAEWYRLRAHYQKHMMVPRMVNYYIPAEEQVAADLISTISAVQDNNGYVHDALVLFSKWAFEAITVIVLNSRLGALDPNLSNDSDTFHFINAVMDVLNGTHDLLIGFQFWRYFQTPAYRKLKKDQEFVAKLSMRYINQAVEKVKSRAVNSDQPLTLLETYLAQDNLTPKDVFVMMTTLMMLGVHSTAVSMTNTLLLLAENPDKQDLAAAEVNRLLPTEDAPITPDILNDMKYVKACYKESLRKRPIVEMNGRYVPVDLVLSGYKVPANTMIMTVNREGGLDPLYVDEPDQFLPERWLKDAPQHKLHNYASLPFGHGPRMCVGRRFAELESHITIAKVLQRYKVEYDDGELDYNTHMVNFPDRPFKLRFIDRK